MLSFLVFSLNHIVKLFLLHVCSVLLLQIGSRSWSGSSRFYIIYILEQKFQEIIKINPYAKPIIFQFDIFCYVYCLIILGHFTFLFLLLISLVLMSLKMLSESVFFVIN